MVDTPGKILVKNKKMEERDEGSDAGDFLNLA